MFKSFAFLLLAVALILGANVNVSMAETQDASSGSYLVLDHTDPGVVQGDVVQVRRDHLINDATEPLGACIVVQGAYMEVLGVSTTGNTIAVQYVSDKDGDNPFSCRQGTTFRLSPKEFSEWSEK